MENLVREIRPDLYQVKLPLPFALREVNCYILKDASGWTIFDTGLNYPASREVWHMAFATIGMRPEAITQIILTHAHPDHYGAAGWLQALAAEHRPEDPPAVYMSPREAEIAALVWHEDSPQPDRLDRHFEQCGMPEDESAKLSDEVKKLAQATRPGPKNVHLLHPDTRLQLGRYTFEVMMTAGHSDGHLVFYEPREKFILCGDHVLLHITPNISIWPGGDPDPLGRYLRSFPALEQLDVEEGWPGHGPRLRDWRGRIAELREHHRQRLHEMAAAVNGRATVYDVCRRVFDLDALTTHEIRFALAETLAHLEYLVLDGRLTRVDHQLWTYRTARAA